MYQLIDIVKEKTGYSGNKIAKEINVSPELVSRWNTHKSEPNGLNTLKLMKLANLERDEIIKIYENGNITLSLLIVTGVASITLVNSIFGALHCILC